MLIRAAPRIFGEVMGELSALIAAGVVPPGCPTVYDLADGPKALAELEARATVGKLALRYLGSSVAISHIANWSRPTAAPHDG